MFMSSIKKYFFQILRKCQKAKIAPAYMKFGKKSPKNYKLESKLPIV